MHIFYQPLADSRQPIIIDKEEAKHLIKVLRMKPGDSVLVTNGKGGMFEAQIKKIQSEQAELDIIAPREFYPARKFNIHIAVAPTKNTDRIEWFVEKSVEMGIEQISFLKTDRSERKNINLERLEKIAISAMKQSMKSTKPILNDLIDFKKFIEKRPEEEKYIAHLGIDNPSHLKNAAGIKKSYCILIGPEGDFSEKEVKLALENKFAPVSLGEYRLRTETAALAACHILNLINEV